MAKVTNLLRRFVLVLVVLAGVLHTRWTTAFLPPSGRASTQRPALLASAGALASLFGAAPSAQADVEEAAGNLADKMYPLMEKIDWQRNPQFASWLATAPEKWDGKKLNTALDKLLEAGLAMDQSLVAKAVQAHLKGIVDSRAEPKDVLKTSAGDVKEITVAIGNMLASAGAKKVMAVYDGFNAVGINDLNRAEWKIVGKAEVAESYRAFLTLGEEIKKMNLE